MKLYAALLVNKSPILVSTGATHLRGDGDLECFLLGDLLML